MYQSIVLTVDKELQQMIAFSGSEGLRGSISAAPPANNWAYFLPMGSWLSPPATWFLLPASQWEALKVVKPAGNNKSPSKIVGYDWNVTRVRDVPQVTTKGKVVGWVYR